MTPARGLVAAHDAGRTNNRTTTPRALRLRSRPRRVYGMGGGVRTVAADPSAAEVMVETGESSPPAAHMCVASYQVRWVDAR